MRIHKSLIIPWLAVLAAAFMPLLSFAQTEQPVRNEEAQGKAIWEEIRSGKINCSDLTVEQYERIGEYVMGTMMGSTHESMNGVLKQRLGDQAEEQMHQAMGKRFSGCDPSAAFPAGMMGFMPMMNGWGTGMWTGGMMGWNAPYQSGNTTYPLTNSFPMMNYSGGWPVMGIVGGGIMMVLWWMLIIIGLVAFIRWILIQSGWSAQQGGTRQTPLEILKQRYARGEIDKKEFEEKKKDLS